jgi:hypothetical protein
MIRWPECVPLPEDRRADTHVMLCPQTVKEVDDFRRAHRWEMPWLCATRSLFIETAVRYLLRTLNVSVAG